MRFTTAVLGLLILYACGKPMTPGDVRLRPTAIVAVTSETFSATVGATVSNQPVVLVKDNYGDPLPGQMVTFAASSGPQPVPASVTTNGAELHPPFTAEQIMGMPALHSRRWTAREVRQLIAGAHLATPRYELVAGELLMTPSPAFQHQRAIREFLAALVPYLSSEPVGEALMSPSDVELEP